MSHTYGKDHEFEKKTCKVENLMNSKKYSWIQKVHENEIVHEFERSS